MKYRLLASSPTLEGISDLIKKYFWADSVILSQVALEKLPNKRNPLVFDVSTSKGLKEGFRVVIKRNRFRFEIMEDKV